MTEDFEPSGSAGRYRSVDGAGDRLAVLAQRAFHERRRAARAARIVADLQARRDRAPASLRPLLSRLVRLHRLFEIRHLEAARLQEHYAARLGGRARRDGAAVSSPTLIDAVASAIGAESAGVTLLGRDGVESMVATSDHLARLAHDVEFVTGEGPAHDVASTMRPVRADGTEIKERWPRYGPVVTEHGVGSLISVPLRREPGAGIGALSVYDTAPAVSAATPSTLARIADALIHTVLNAPGVVPHEEIPAVSFFDGADFLATVHRAAGVVAVRHSCPTADAVALLRARAFADGIPVETLANQVIKGDLQL